MQVRSILEFGKKPLSWKPEEGLVELFSARKKLFSELKKIPGNTPLIELPLPNDNKYIPRTR